MEENKLAAITSYEDALICCRRRALQDRWQLIKKVLEGLIHSSRNPVDLKLLVKLESVIAQLEPILRDCLVYEYKKENGAGRLQWFLQVVRRFI